ncbi:MAG: DEAD/DEAH box helicase [Thermoprotei archaeon]|nr:MAG: DEAD/DEAH box helicase [Thermoprotei archaeon]
MPEGAFGLLHPRLRSVIERHGYFKPTPVQERAIPLALRGYNVLIVAPTGTGKTEAALFPAISRVLSEGRSEEGIKIVYVTPLRALNRDILRRMQRIAAEVGLTAMVRHGDTPASLRRRMAVEPPDLLITTPETLQFVLAGRVIRRFLSSVRCVIVDELHELLDDKRGAQLSLALERLASVAGGFQRMGLSATISDVNLAKRFLCGYRRAYEVVVSIPRGTEITVDCPQPTPEDAEVAEGLGVPPATAARLRRIGELLKTCTSALIFANTRDTAELLASKLALASSEGVRVHHGSLSRGERLEAEDEFKRRRLKALVCTSSLELGIDIGHVDLVIQYLSPRQALKLLQRVGRSGHGLSMAPRGVVVAEEGDDVLESLVIARRALGGDLEPLAPHRKPYDVLAHQVVGLLIERGRLRLGEVLDLASRAYPYSDLTLSELRDVVKFLDSVGYVRLRGDELRLRRGAHKYYYECASTIPDTAKFRVKDLASGRVIGELDEEFVASYCEPDSTFVLSGRVWRVASVDEERAVVEVTPTSDVLGAIPAWEGELIPVSYHVAREVGALRRRLREALQSGRDPMEVLREYPGTPSAHAKAVEYVREQLSRAGFVPDDRTVVVENAGRVVVVHCAFGSKVNATLALLLSYMLLQMFRVASRTHSDPYRVLLAPSRPLSNEEIAKALEMVVRLRGELEEQLTEPLRASAALRWRMAQVARRFGVVERGARVSRRVIDALRGTLVEVEAMRELMVERLNCDRLREVLGMIEGGRISVTYVVTATERLSPMALPILKSAVWRDYIIPSVPLSALLRVVKRRLLEEEVRLVCLHRLDWTTLVKVKDLDDGASCPKCGSRFLAVLKRGEGETLEALRKKLRGLKLSRDEERLLRRAQLSARLFLTYGKLAAMALAGRGVGPSTAARILRDARDEDHLVELVLKAEREYSRTRQYWD